MPAYLTQNDYDDSDDEVSYETRLVYGIRDDDDEDPEEEK